MQDSKAWDMPRTTKAQPKAKKYTPSGYEQAIKLLEAGEKNIPAKVVRKMLKEWNQETGWTATMARKIQATLDRYSP